MRQIDRPEDMPVLGKAKPPAPAPAPQPAPFRQSPSHRDFETDGRIVREKNPSTP